MNPSNNGFGPGEVPGNRSSDPASNKNGAGRGKFSSKILLPLQQPQPGINTNNSNQHISRDSTIPAPADPASVVATRNGNKFLMRKELSARNYQRKVNREPRQFTAERREINIRLTPGMGMRDVDPDYLDLMNRHIDNINDPENENWEID